MKEPTRVRDESSDPFHHALLDSASSDEPNADDRARMLVSLGLGGAALGTAGLSAAGAGAAATAEAGWLTTIKWWASGVIVASLTAAGGYQLTSRAPDAPVVDGVAGHTSAVSQRADLILKDDRRPQMHTLAPVRDSAPAVAPDASTQRTPDREWRASAAPAASQLADEIALLERVRRANAQGNTAEAQRAIAEYNQRFGNRKNTLGPEAEVLAVETHANHGDHEKTLAAGRRYLARHPNSPGAGRVRSLMAAARAALKTQ